MLEVMATGNEKQQPGIFKLPLEIRLRIYEYAVFGRRHPTAKDVGLDLRWVQKDWGAARRSHPGQDGLQWSFEETWSQLWWEGFLRMPTLAALHCSGRQVHQDLGAEMAKLVTHTFRIHGRWNVPEEEDGSMGNLIRNSTVFDAQRFEFNINFELRWDKLEDSESHANNDGICFTLPSTPAVLRFDRVHNGQFEVDWVKSPVDSGARPPFWTTGELLKIKDAMLRDSKSILRTKGMNRESLEQILESLYRHAQFDRKPLRLRVY